MYTAMLDTYLPKLNELTREVRRGRCVYDGYQRGWGLQFGEVGRSVELDPIYQRAMKLAGSRIIQSDWSRMNVFLILRFFLSELPPGDIVEFGSYRGGSAIFMASILRDLHPDRRVWALDTYKGMPSTEKSVDAHNIGDFHEVNFEELVSYGHECGLDNLHFIKGMFQDTWPRIVLDESPVIALAHIDCDIKSSVSYSYNAVKPSMVRGGYIVLDDATVSSCIGATEATEEIIQTDRIFSEQIWPHYVFRHGLTS